MMSVRATTALLLPRCRSSMRENRAGKQILLMPGITAMDRLERKALGGVAKMQAVLAAMIFGAAWSLDYWQGWVFWVVFGAAVLLTTVHLLRHDRALVERRMHA